MSRLTVVGLGDSGTEGLVNIEENRSIGQGGLGNWFDVLIEQLANRLGFGPILTSGVIGSWRAFSGDWSFTTAANAWSLVTGAMAFDKFLSFGTFANGINKIATVNKSRYWRPAVAFEPWFFDYGAGGDWQMEIDGSGSWLNMSSFAGAPLHNDGLRKFRVPLPVASTVRFRGYNGAIDCGCGLAGIEWVWNTGTDGVVGHNWGVAALKLSTIMTAGSGDRLAPLDSVGVIGGALNPTPDFLIAMFPSDAHNANPAGWNTDVTNLRARFAKPMGLMSYPRGNPATVPTVDQVANRAQSAVTAANLGIPYLDLDDKWVKLGYTTSALSTAGGLFRTADQQHMTQRGYLSAASFIQPWVENNFVTVGRNSSAYPSRAGVPVPAVRGSVPSSAARGAGPQRGAAGGIPYR